MKIEAFSNIGKRKNNQDSFWASKVKVNDKDMAILLVCDGMGGTKDGFLASSSVVSGIRSAILEGKYTTLDIENAVLDVHKDLKLQGGDSGTTVTYLWTDGLMFGLYHIGDSRCYIYRNGTYTLISEDHTVSADARRGFFGAKSKDLVKTPDNILSRCIGVGNNTIPYVIDSAKVVGDGFLVCSDGFWHTFNEMGENKDLEKAIDQAINSGERDNITVLRVLF